MFSDREQVSRDVGATGEFACNTSATREVVAFDVIHPVDAAPHGGDDVKVTVCNPRGGQFNVSVKL